MPLPDIQKFRELNKELYGQPPSSTVHSRLYFRAKISGTLKEKTRRRVQGKAQDIVRQLVRKGIITKPTSCQICNSERKLLAHHWKGYDFPLDIWWICHSCHRKLPHPNGPVTLEQAGKIVLSNDGLYEKGL